MAESLLSTEFHHALLKPIQGESPVGHFLKYEDVYDKIQAAREEESEELPQGVWERELKTADWKAVINLSQTSLQNTTKDLQIAAWLCEALLEHHDFKGLEEGIVILDQLTREFWMTIYPKIDEESADDEKFDYRLSPFNWMNEKLPLRFLTKVVAQTDSEKSQPIFFHTWHKYEKKPNAAKKKEIETCIQFTGENYYKDLKESVKNTRVILLKLSDFLKDRTSSAEGIFYRLINELENVERFATGALNHIAEKAAESEKQESSDVDSEQSNNTENNLDTPQNKPQKQADGVRTQTPNTEPRHETGIRNRDEAYELVELVLSYLKDTDPHSLSINLLSLSLLWRDKSLAEIVSEIGEGESGMQALLSLVSKSNKA